MNEKIAVTARGVWLDAEMVMAMHTLMDHDTYGGVLYRNHPDDELLSIYDEPEVLAGLEKLERAGLVLRLFTVCRDDIRAVSDAWVLTAEGAPVGWDIWSREGKFVSFLPTAFTPESRKALGMHDLAALAS